MIKKAVRESRGQNIINLSSTKEVWNSINDILQPDRLSKTNIRIETDGQTIEDPLEIAEKFNVYFKEKVERLAAGIKNNQNIDPLSKLKNKLHGSDLKIILKQCMKEKY